jgi:hypothetical protein
MTNQENKSSASEFRAQVMLFTFFKSRDEVKAFVDSLFEYYANASSNVTCFSVRYTKTH